MIALNRGYASATSRINGPIAESRSLFADQPLSSYLIERPYQRGTAAHTHISYDTISRIVNHVYPSIVCP